MIVPERQIPLDAVDSFNAFLDQVCLALDINMPMESGILSAVVTNEAPPYIAIFEELFF